MMEWIRIDNELPPEDVEILFTYDGKVEYGCYIWYDPDYRWQESSSSLYRYDVTHWMPIPDAPDHIVSTDKKVEDTPTT